MNPVDNPFVKRQLKRMYAIERDIIRLYAEACYSNIQAAHGNLSSMSRIEELNEALFRAGIRLKALKVDLRRLGVPSEAMLSLDDLQRLNLFEAQFKRHDAAFACQQDIFGRRQLSEMLADIEEPQAIE